MSTRTTPTVPPVLKPDVVRDVAFRADLLTKDAKVAVDAFIDTIREALADGATVSLFGFGTFTTRPRAARKGRDPRTGESVPVPAHRGVVFRACKTLLD